MAPDEVLHSRMKAPFENRSTYLGSLLAIANKLTATDCLQMMLKYAARRQTANFLLEIMRALGTDDGGDATGNFGS